MIGGVDERREREGFVVIWRERDGWGERGLASVEESELLVAVGVVFAKVEESECYEEEG